MPPVEEFLTVHKSCSTKTSLIKYRNKIMKINALAQSYLFLFSFFTTLLTCFYWLTENPYWKWFENFINIMWWSFQNVFLFFLTIFFVSPGIDRIQPDLLGRPLTEPDPYYKQKFTCVILKRSRYKASTYIYRFHSGRALYLFSPFNLIRQACIKITTSTLFSNFILFTILVNCAFLSVDQQFPIAEYIFAGIYGIEFVIKIVALGGFLDSHTYSFKKRD